MIEARTLTKRYDEKLAVDALSFTIRPGVVTGFLGPNGAGKSTTMRMMMGLDRPTSGTVLVNGKPYAEPVNGLDLDGIRWIRALLTRLAGEGRTVFLSSHLMSEMAVTAEHVIVIGKGRLLRDQPMADFIREASVESIRVVSPDG